MKIRKMRATFGKLQNETLSFHDGLNVIFAPNESGKSTWCAFISAMLYGIDSSERARSGYLPDKQRYSPWSGAPMEGTMDLTADRSDITITRRTASKNAPMREFSATYTGTGNPVAGMTGTNCGELLTGVSKDVFRRSAFIPQGAVAVSGSPELEKRISSIVSTGEETGSYSEADARMRAWLRKRRNGRRGMLPELEAKMDEAQLLLDEMDNSVNNVHELEKQLEETHRKCAQLEAAVTESRRRQRRDALDRLNQGRDLVQQRSDSHDAALADLSRKREALRSSDFGDRTTAEIREEVRQDLETCQLVAEDAKKSASFFPALLLAIFAVAAAGLYSAFGRTALIITAGVACLASVLLFIRYSRIRQSAQNALDVREEILRKYKVSVPEDIPSVLQKQLALEDAVLSAELEEQRSRESFDRARQQQHALEESAVNELDFTGGDSEAARLSRALTALRSEEAALSSKIATLNGRLSAMGDPMVLASALGCMREEADQLQKEYDAISLAIEVLRDADNEIQSRFSPELGRLTAQYMAEMTGGRYADILVDRDFSARARSREDTVAHDSAYLSAGTVDLMYLAVRLAVCELALPGGEPCPLIIDDALVNLDAQRFQQAMTLLKKIALERQVILFTCRKEESR